MNFEYRRTVGRARLAVSTAYVLMVPVFVGLAAYLVFMRREPSAVLFGEALAALLVLILPFLAWNLTRLARGAGEWNIRVTPSEIVWQVPQNIGQEGFRLPMREVRKIVHEWSSGNEDDGSYFIETVSKQTYALNLAFSGLPIRRFCRALEKAGVTYESRVRK